VLWSVGSITSVMSPRGEYLYWVLLPFSSVVLVMLPIALQVKCLLWPWGSVMVVSWLAWSHSRMIVLFNWLVAYALLGLYWCILRYVSLEPSGCYETQN